MKRLILGFFILIFVSACKQSQVPEGIIETRKMILVLTDVHLIDSYVSSAAFDSTTQPSANYYKVMYNKYKIDSVQLQKSLRYYSRETELLDTMYYQVLKRLETLELMENRETQQKVKAAEALEIQKKNAEIKLKPQPNWFFRYDTAGLFNKLTPTSPTAL
ncbi:MAG TPA: DUF4296 domain-containing protein [Daejeonella sp.]|nr:DUF4296 domain-containing protein [Daejeonella sp.]